MIKEIMFIGTQLSTDNRSDIDTFPQKSPVLLIHENSSKQVVGGQSLS